MTKTIEEGVLELICEIVKHCYKRGLFPWHEKRDLRQQGLLAGGVRNRDDGGREYDDVYYRLPLSIEETVNDVNLHQHPGIEAERQHIHNEIPQPQQQLPPFGRPLFLRNHVGLRLENEAGFEGRLHQPPMFIDRDNRQVVLSQRALWTLIDLVPWNELSNRRNQGNAAVETRNNQSNRGNLNNTENSRADARPSQSVSMLPPTPNDAEVSTSLRVLSAKCLARITRLRLTDKDGKESDMSSLFEQLRNLNESSASEVNAAPLVNDRRSQSFIQNLLRLHPLRVSTDLADYRAQGRSGGDAMSALVQNNSKEIQTT